VTVRRLVLTAAAMAAVAAALRALTGPWQASLATLGDATQVSATVGPEPVVLATVGLLAWAAWAWGALGLLLTAAAALPGVCGLVARVLSRLVLPAGLRTASGLALGVGLVVAAPAASAAPATGPAPVAVPDWPSADPSPPAPPDWPTDTKPAATDHVVTRGDCLWRIAEDHLVTDGLDPTDADVARAVDDWWSTNASVIGPDPDLIHPGQLLRSPASALTPSDPPPGSTR
jgi:nucleoid-associated protein YgaU